MTLVGGLFGLAGVFGLVERPAKLLVAVAVVLGGVLGAALWEATRFS